MDLETWLFVFSAHVCAEITVLSGVALAKTLYSRLKRK